MTKKNEMNHFLYYILFKLHKTRQNIIITAFTSYRLLETSEISEILSDSDSVS